VQRLVVARRTAEVIDEQRTVLMTRLSEAAHEERSARETWDAAAREADRWLARAVLPGGGRQLDVGISFVTHPAEVKVAWATVMGVTLPVDGVVSRAAGPDMVVLGAGSALVLAAEAHRRALEAAVIHAVADERRRRLETQLRRTVRRLRALQKRWIPMQESMLRELHATLEEGERGESTRMRWLARRSRAAR
jgi:V/A-type H+-transporting ATPase subunit D